MDENKIKSILEGLNSDNKNEQVELGPSGSGSNDWYSNYDIVIEIEMMISTDEDVERIRNGIYDYTEYILEENAYIDNYRYIFEPTNMAGTNRLECEIRLIYDDSVDDLVDEYGDRELERMIGEVAGDIKEELRNVFDYDVRVNILG